MINGVERPLVTFYVMTYNQARFVRQAVEAALAQTYSPLQIVLSDDCSTDGTFEIIQEAVKGYSGPHVVVLNRNDRNLGISDHVNRIIELATGELIISADGDDVSSPVRAERCVDVWIRNGRPAALYSAVSCIDAEGRPSRRDGNKWFAQFLPVEHETRTTDCCGSRRTDRRGWSAARRPGRRNCLRPSDRCRATSGSRTTSSRFGPGCSIASSTFRRRLLATGSTTRTSSTGSSRR